MATLQTHLAFVLIVCGCLQTFGRVGVAGIPLAANQRIRRSTCPYHCPCGVKIDLTSCTCKECEGDSSFSIASTGPKDVKFKRSSCPRACPCGDYYDGHGKCRCNPCPNQDVALRPQGSREALAASSDISDKLSDFARVEEV